MIRKAIYIISIVLLVVIVYLFYKRIQTKPTQTSQPELIKAIPANPSVVLSTNNINALNALILSKNNIWDALSYINFWGKTTKQLHHIDSLLEKEVELKFSLSSCPVAISFHNSGSRTFIPLVAIELNEKINAESIARFFAQQLNLKTNVKNYNETVIHTYNHNGNTEGYFVFEGIFVWSSSDLLLERSLREFGPRKGLIADNEFLQLYDARGTEPAASIFIHTSRFGSDLDKYSLKKISIPFDAFWGRGSWIAADISASENNLSLAGFVAGSDNASLVSHIKTQKSQKPSVFEVIPMGTNELRYLSITNKENFLATITQNSAENSSVADFNLWQTKTENIIGTNPAEVFLKNVGNQFAFGETGSTIEDKPAAFVICDVSGNTQAADKFKGYLEFYAGNSGKNLQSLITVYDLGKGESIEILEFQVPDFFYRIFGNISGSKEINFITFYKNFLIGAAEKNNIISIISSVELGKNLTHDESFTGFYEKMVSESNLFIFSSARSASNRSKTLFKSAANEPFAGTETALGKLNGLGLQLLDTRNMMYLNAAIDYTGKADVKDESVWQSLLDTTFVMKPVFFDNHYTGEKEIFLQDKANTIYLISASGKILWKKKIEEVIISDVYQVDCFKNGKFQLLFNSASRLYLIDRNGNYVERYPVRLPSDATAGLGLADYEKKRDYRIFIPTVDKQILLFGIDGNIVKGWEFGKTDFEVTVPVQHFRFKNLDYIVFFDKAGIYILDRKGKSRIKTKEPITLAANGRIFAEINGPGGAPAFVTIDNNGIIKHILLSGNVIESNFGIGTGNIFWEFADINGDAVNEFMVANENKLTTYNNKGTVLFERSFTQLLKVNPSLYRFSSRDTKIGVTDTGLGLIYLINNDGTDYDGFPVPGSTAFSIGFLKPGSGSFALIVGRNDNFLYNYLVK